MKHFVFSLDCPPDLFLGSLSKRERARASKFHFARDRDAYIVAHGRVREILAEEIGCEKAAIVLKSSEKGKPFVVFPESELQFSLSHSHGMGMVALSRRPVGADIEKIVDKPDRLAVAKRFFVAAEAAAIESSANPVLAFTQTWVLKEAYVKALGEGIAYGLDRFGVDVNLPKQVVDGVELQLVEAPDGYCAATATFI